MTNPTPKGTTMDEHRRRMKMIRTATTKANAKYGIGGAEKTTHRPKPITLAKVDIAPVKP